MNLCLVGFLRISTIFEKCKCLYEYKFFENESRFVRLLSNNPNMASGHQS